MRNFLVLLPLLVVAIWLDATTRSATGPLNIQHEFPYPIQGWEYVAALLATGFIASGYRGRSIWALPVTVVIFFAAGLACSMRLSETPFPIVPFVFLSIALVIGLLFSGRSLRLRVAIPIFAATAALHGFAHGLHYSSEVSAVGYSREVVTATAILLLLGVGIGVGLRLFIRHLRTPSISRVAETPI